MATSTTSTDGGRTVVQLHDDSGEPYKFVAQPVDLLGQSEFNVAITIPLKRDPHLDPPRPDLTRGQIFITAQAVPTEPASVEYILAEVRVLGYVGSFPTVIATAMLGGDQQSMRITFAEEDTFDRIAIEARQIVDGEPSSATTGVEVLQLGALAYMWS